MNSQTARVSLGTASAQGNGPSSKAKISGSGFVVAFESTTVYRESSPITAELIAFTPVSIVGSATGLK
jgi:hypothetical protein